MKEEGESPFVLHDDINSSDFKYNKLSFQKKLIIGISLIALILILIIIIIIAYNKSKEPINNINDKIGEIICIYDIESTSKEKKILSDKFEKKNSNFDIYIGDKKIKYSKSYKFKEIGENKVKYILFGEINMDYMFADLLSLLSVEMISNKNAKIS